MPITAYQSPITGFDAVGLGQCAFDVLGRLVAYPPVDAKAELSQLVCQGGGPVATALVTLARLGVSTAFLGRVGDDEYGDRICRGLVDEGVDCRGLSRDAGASSQFAFIAVEEASARRNIFWHRGSARPLTAAEVSPELIENSRILHLDGLQHEASMAAARIARRGGVATVLDGGTLRDGSLELLPLIDHPVVSEKFARQLAGSDDPLDALPRLLECGAVAATVTLGEGGSWSRTRAGESFHQPAFAVEAVDTTGCGDVFHGGYIYGLLRSWPLRRAVRFAAACAALKTRALGGRTAIPRLEEVEGFLASQQCTRSAGFCPEQS